METTNIYKNVERIAQEKGCSIFAVSEAAGLDRTTVFKWRDKSPNVDSLLKVANVLGVSLDELIKETK